MYFSTIEFSTITIVFFSFFIAGGLALLLYYFFIILRVGLYKDKTLVATQNTDPVSVVICSKDEYHNLKEKLFYIMEQEYPNFEVIVVNHASQDETEYLLKIFTETYPHLKIVNLKEDINHFSGKKFPLSLGIKSAKNDLILLTDADCVPNSYKWVEHIKNHFSENTEFVLSYGAYSENGTMLNSFIQYETLATAASCFGYALLGKPYMGVGRNLAYRKSFFFEKGSFIKHYQIASGDDDLFVNQNANKSNTEICLEPNSFTISEPKTRFKDWMMQKRRHLSTHRYYKPFDKCFLFAYPISVLLFHTALILLLLYRFSWEIVIGVLIIKLTVQIISFYKLSKRLCCKKKVYLFAPLFELFFTFFDGFVSLLSLNTKKTRWK